MVVGRYSLCRSSDAMLAMRVDTRLDVQSVYTTHRVCAVMCTIMCTVMCIVMCIVKCTNTQPSLFAPLPKPRPHNPSPTHHPPVAQHISYPSPQIS